MNNQVSTNLSYINTVLADMDEARHQMYNAIEATKLEIRSINNWMGEDKEAFRNNLLICLQKLMNSEKWMNEITWELKVQAEKMTERAKNSANEIQGTRM